MPRPICFMIMPYSTKPTGAPAGTEAPDKVNFDRLGLRPCDRQSIKPDTNQSAQTRTPISCSQSIPNGNVYYEVGIRHAAQRNAGMLAKDAFRGRAGDALLDSPDRVDARIARLLAGCRELLLDAAEYSTRSRKTSVLICWISGNPSTS